MHPVLIELPGLTLYSYGILGAVAFLLVSFATIREARRRGWSQDRVVDVLFWGAIAGLVGARLLWVAQNLAAVTGPWTVLNLREGGLVFYGAFLGLPVGWWVARRGGIPPRAFADVLAAWLPVGHGISRLGCYAAGCCYGHPTDLPWAVTYSHPLSAAPHDVPLHPVQLYEAAGLFLLGGLLAWVKGRARFEGQVLLTYLGLYAVLRSATELFRGDADRDFLLSSLLGEAVSTSQGIAAAFLVLVAALWRRWSTAPTSAGAASPG